MNERMYGQVGEKRNMSALEMKVDALMQFCTAESEETRRKYHIGLRQLMAAQDAAGMGSRPFQAVDNFFCSGIITQTPPNCKTSPKRQDIHNYTAC